MTLSWLLILWCSGLLSLLFCDFYSCRVQSFEVLPFLYLRSYLFFISEVLLSSLYLRSSHLLYIWGPPIFLYLRSSHLYNWGPIFFISEGLLSSLYQRASNLLYIWGPILYLKSSYLIYIWCPPILFLSEVFLYIWGTPVFFIYLRPSCLMPYLLYIWGHSIFFIFKVLLSLLYDVLLSSLYLKSSYLIYIWGTILFIQTVSFLSTCTEHEKVDYLTKKKITSINRTLLASPTSTNNSRSTK